MSRKKALLLINEHSRKGKENAELVRQQLETLGLELVRDSVEKCEDLPNVVRKHQHQVDLVIVGGGDGTLNAIADSIVETKLPLGIIPLGTANDLARTLQIPLNISEACKVIANGDPYAIDLGWVNGKHFFNVASMGLSVKITENLSKDRKRRWGVLAYLGTALEVIRHIRPLRAKIIVDGQAINVKSLQIAIGNGRYYGGGLTVAHDAAIDDQRLDLYSLELQHWWQILGLGTALVQGRHRETDGSRYLSGTEFEIYTSRPHNINTDGEITTKTPAKFKVISQAIAVMLTKKPKNNP